MKAITEHRWSFYFVYVVMCFSLAMLLAGCGQPEWNGRVWEVKAAAAHGADGELLSFGDSCADDRGLPDGLCCCHSTGLASYGAKKRDSSKCSDDEACSGKRSGHCASRPSSGGPPFWAQATRDFCEFDCACCSHHKFASSLVQRDPGKPSLVRKWEQDPVMFFDVSNDSFHRDLMSSIESTHSLHEFYNHTFTSPSWLKFANLQKSKGWDESELAMYLYTTESPPLYVKMNRMLREATSMSDISAYWQSYMALLKRGLQTKARYATLDVYRGVPSDAADFLKEGTWGVLPSFTSTSADRQVAHGFGQTVLHVTGGGYDVSSYSAFPGEQELLLEPGRLYEVTKKETDSNGKTTILLETKGPNSMRLPPTVENYLESGTKCSHFDTAVCTICSCCEHPRSAFLATSRGKAAARKLKHAKLRPN